MYITKKGYLLTIFLIYFISVADAQDVSVKLGNNDGSSKFTISNSNSTERIRITDQGVIGIGTSTPTGGQLAIHNMEPSIYTKLY